MYKVSNGNITVSLESPEGSATLVFRKAKLNELLEAQSELEKQASQLERVRLSFQQILSRLISVTDMLDENEQPVTVERIQSLDFDPATMNAIVEAYNLVIGADKPVSPEKKD